jgi:hypothetical protein
MKIPTVVGTFVAELEKSHHIVNRGPVNCAEGFSLAPSGMATPRRMEPLYKPAPLAGFLFFFHPVPELYSRDTVGIG